MNLRSDRTYLIQCGERIRRARAKYAAIVSSVLRRTITDQGRDAVFSMACRNAVERGVWAHDPEHRATRFAMLRKIARADGAKNTWDWYRWLNVNGWHLSYRRGKACIQSRKYERMLRAV